MDHYQVEKQGLAFASDLCECRHWRGWSDQVVLAELVNATLHHRMTSGLRQPDGWSQTKSCFQVEPVLLRRLMSCDFKKHTHMISISVAKNIRHGLLKGLDLIMPMPYPMTYPPPVTMPLAPSPKMQTRPGGSPQLPKQRSKAQDTGSQPVVKGHLKTTKPRVPKDSKTTEPTIEVDAEIVPAETVPADPIDLASGSETEKL